MSGHFCTELDRIAQACYRTSAEHGFHDEPRNVGETIALITSELSEALEEWRTGNPLDHTYYREGDGKPEGFGFELADAVIRILDTAVDYGIPLGSLILEKMAFNEGRPHMHGKIA